MQRERFHCTAVVFDGVKQEFAGVPELRERAILLGTFCGRRRTITVTVERGEQAEQARLAGATVI